MGIGIFRSDGTRSRFQRKLAIHIFTVKALKEYVSEVFVNEGYKAIKYLGKAADQGVIVDFHQLMLHCTLESPSAKALDALTKWSMKSPLSSRSTASMPLALISLSTRPGGSVRFTSAGAKAQHDKSLIAQHA
ncbi:hypothetical protein BG006_010389 [Podila minutissima]|uniref:Uncharacterized protein n=1 Tax=Podila minutissima TaxID=64525 RepID=A0A9P5SQ66_9FUNG|nr:hypothetical protein BG006_010389 [Podila minutissima]